MPADTKELTEKLNDLIALDTDAVHAYTAAIDRMTVPMLKERLREFRGDHEQHIRDLTAAVRHMGEEPRESKPDVKGFFLKSFTAITSTMGDVAALRAMQGNEELTNSSYDKALELAWPSDLKAIIEKNRDDERRHLKFIQDSLRDRPWEAEHPAQP